MIHRAFILGFVLRLLMMQNLTASYSYMKLEATLNDSWYDHGPWASSIVVHIKCIEIK
jgi:hypothetical protein